MKSIEELREEIDRLHAEVSAKYVEAQALEKEILSIKNFNIFYILGKIHSKPAESSITTSTSSTKIVMLKKVVTNHICM